jgi:hypothetical protein
MSCAHMRRIDTPYIYTHGKQVSHGEKKEKAKKQKNEKEKEK